MTNTIRQDVNILGTLSAQGISPELVNKILGNVYRVGAIYISTNSTSPASLFGGTWERIQDKFLLSAGSSYSAGTSGGSADAVVVAHEGHLYDWHSIPYGEGTADGKFLYVDTLGNAGYAGGRGWNNTINEVYPAGHATGESGIGKNMPPYLAVYMWKKVED